MPIFEPLRSHDCYGREGRDARNWPGEVEADGGHDLFTRVCIGIEALGLTQMKLFLDSDRSCAYEPRSQCLLSTLVLQRRYEKMSSDEQTQSLSLPPTAENPNNPGPEQPQVEVEVEVLLPGSSLSLSDAIVVSSG